MSDKTAIIREAQKFLARGQIDKAIAEWEKLIKESPDANTYNTVGDLYLKKGDKTPAIESFHKAARFFRDEGFSLKALALYKKILNIDTSNTSALYALGELSEEKGLATDAIKYYLASADILSKEGKKDELLKAYDKILSLSPSNIPLRNKVAEIFKKEGLQIEAAKEYLHIARLYDEKDDVNNAGMYYKKSLDLQPNNNEALLGLSSIYEKTGNPRQAQEYLKKAVELAPSNTELILKYAESLVKAKSFSEAMQYISKVTEIDPSNTAARKLLGEMYAESGDKQKAWEEYKVIIDEIIFDGKLDEAINILTMFIDTEPVETRKKLVALYKQKNDYESAFAELVSLGDAFIFSEERMLKEALECYKEASEIHPDDNELKEKISDIKRELDEEYAEPKKSVEESLAEAEFYLRQGLYEEAKAAYQKLLELFPDNNEIREKLSLIEAKAREEVRFEEKPIEEVEKPAETVVETPTEEFVISDILEAETAPEFTLESDVLGIFEEFKKGLEKEIGIEDSETHYNLGIAYKEMGLIDDAIKEFQTSKNDPERLIPSISMLGMCYMAKGLYPLAIDSFNTVMEKIGTKDESYWGVKYELAEACEKNENLKEALRHYTEVYGWNSKFRNVAEKINLLNVHVSKPAEKPVLTEKQKIKKERVSYL
ncbi:MAG: tetratricopeptide repeat protein [Thermodesulfovibrionales bacterium]